MLEYDVRISEPAEADIDTTFQYLFVRDVGLAEKWRDHLFQAIDSLKNLPRRCSIAPENTRFVEEIRQLWFGSRRSAYRILFCVFDSTAQDLPVVWILRVRHHSQRLMLPDVETLEE